MVTVFLESPYAGDVEVNVAYAEACMIHSIMLGEAPFASHLLYTQMLDDANPLDRAAGLTCAKAWREKAERVVVYIDRGISPGMQAGIDHASAICKPVEFREIYIAAEKAVTRSGPMSDSDRAKLSVAIDRGVRDYAKAAARARGISFAYWVERAITHEVVREATDLALEEDLVVRLNQESPGV